MRIIAHRGYWRLKEEVNTMIAFNRAIDCGFGIETDIRDMNGKIVISHDMPGDGVILLDELLKIWQKRSPGNALLALNIKADGLSVELRRLIDKYQIDNYFVFDMSVPELLNCQRNGIVSYTRQSEYEENPSCYDSVAGVWIDEFNRHWLTYDIISAHVSMRKQICIVSPELHGRDYSSEWREYKMIDVGHHSMAICTDYPRKAEDYFNE